MYNFQKAYGTVSVVYIIQHISRYNAQSNSCFCFNSILIIVEKSLFQCMGFDVRKPVFSCQSFQTNKPTFIKFKAFDGHFSCPDSRYCHLFYANNCILKFMTAANL